MQTIQKLIRMGFEDIVSSILEQELVVILWGLREVIGRWLGAERKFTGITPMGNFTCWHKILQ